jgi:hypothetical protein
MRLSAIVLAVFLAGVWLIARPAPASADPWLFVTDIHLAASSAHQRKSPSP